MIKLEYIWLQTYLSDEQEPKKKERENENFLSVLCPKPVNLYRKTISSYNISTMSTRL